METEAPENTVYISADDVGVRHQREHRTVENQKNGAFFHMEGVFSIQRIFSKWKI